MLLKSLIRWLIVSLMLVRSLNAATDVRLVEAIKKTDKVAVRTLLQQRVDVNAPEVDGTTALHWAARSGDLEITKLLIGARANVKAANRYGVTPLYLACVNGSAAIVELLLKEGADPNTALPEGETALMTAARIGNAAVMRVLLAHAADVNAKESWRGQTALMWAAAEGHAEAVRALVEQGADIRARSNEGFSALLFAVREGKTDAVRALLEAGANVNETLLRTTASRRPANSNNTAEPAGGPSALVLAVGNAHYGLAALLLDRGADPNAAAQGWTALHEITWVRKPGTGSNNPAPAGSGQLDSLAIVRKLAAHGANLNFRVTKRPNAGTTLLNLMGASPFFLAARTADVELMRLLVELGADPLLPNEDDTIPLMAAAGVGTFYPGEDPGTESEVLEAVKVALELGGDLNAVDKNGETAMHGAAYKQVPSVVRFLVEKGAKIQAWNHKNKKGWTPLNIAEGIVRGMDIVDSPATAAAIRAAMNN